MNNTFKSYSEMVSVINSRADNAVKATCDRLLSVLQDTIMSSYYEQYSPKEYIRTMAFFSSAITRMLSTACGEILMNKDAMNKYKEWNGELQLEYANQGFHGTKEIKTSGRFWNEFLSYCDNHALQILKEELINQGIHLM